MTNHHKEQILFLFYSQGKDLWEISRILHEPYKEVQEYYKYASHKYKRLVAKFVRWGAIKPKPVLRYQHTDFKATNANDFSTELVRVLGAGWRAKIKLANKNLK